MTLCRGHNNGEMSMEGTVKKTFTLVVSFSWYSTHKRQKIKSRCKLFFYSLLWATCWHFIRCHWQWRSRKRTYMAVDEPVWGLRVLLHCSRPAEETNKDKCCSAALWTREQTFPHGCGAAVYLWDSLESRLFRSSSISCRPSSTPWLCFDLFPRTLTLFLPLDASWRLTCGSKDGKVYQRRGRRVTYK